MTKLLEKLKERWGVETLWQVGLILVIFSITGYSALYVRRFVFDLFGFDASTPGWLRVITWLVTVVPSYQVLFLFYGFLLGQFDFVWEFEKKSLRRFKRIFGRSGQSD